MSKNYKKSTVVVISRRMLESEAYIDLSGTAAKVLIWFLGKRKMGRLKGNSRQDWVQLNNGELQFTYREALEKYRLSGQTFSRILDELVATGFLDIASPGFGIAKVTSRYGLSRRWEKYGTEDFDPSIRHKRISHRFPTGKNHPIHNRIGTR